MKFLTIISSIVLVTILFFSSCTDEKLSKDNQQSFATVYTDEKGEAQYFILDNSTSLYVVKSETNYKPTNQRVFIDYLLLDTDYANFDYAIRLNGYIYDILTKPIAYVPADDKIAQDSIGYNAVDIISGFAKGDYITLRFKYKMAGESGQLFTMLAANKTINENGKLPIKLMFRHNIEKDKENYLSKDTYICFNIKEYVKAYANNPNLSFDMSWTDLDGKEQSLLLIHSGRDK